MAFAPSEPNSQCKLLVPGESSSARAAALRQSTAPKQPLAWPRGEMVPASRASLCQWSARRAPSLRASGGWSLRAQSPRASAHPGRGSAPTSPQVQDPGQKKQGSRALRARRDQKLRSLKSKPWRRPCMPSLGYRDHNQSEATHLSDSALDPELIFSVESKRAAPRPYP